MIPVKTACDILIHATTFLKAVVAIEIWITWAIPFINMADFASVCVIEIKIRWKISYISTLTEELIPLQCEDLGQVRFHILHQRRKPRVRGIAVQILLSVDSSCLKTTFTDIPLRREFAHLLVSEIILEENHATTNKVALLVLSHGRIVILGLVEVGLIAFRLLGTFLFIQDGVRSITSLFVSLTEKAIASISMRKSLFIILHLVFS